MPRLLPGQDAKIDMINQLVADARSDDKCKSGEGLMSLLNLFQPMMLKICKQWSEYFHDSNHTIKSFDELLADAQYWFIKYTLETYIPDGRATYNKFIKDHINQRVRYIYECEVKYFKKNIFPDPDMHGDNDDEDMFESVAYNYTSQHDNGIEDNMINKITRDDRNELAHKIQALLDDTQYFNPREKTIFTEIVCNGVTHDEMGKRLNISRTRVTQILRKIKVKLYKLMENSQQIWDLIGNIDIKFDEME
jgi:RNA polymerase sigma factor (sigma-70 family)